MIEVRAVVNKGDVTIDVKGHATGQEGEKVCAAVSAVVQTAIAGLQQIALVHPDHLTVNVEQKG